MADTNEAAAGVPRCPLCDLPTYTAEGLAQHIILFTYVEQREVYNIAQAMRNVGIAERDVRAYRRALERHAR